MSWSTSLACPASSAEGIPGSLVSSRRRLALPGRERLPGSSRAARVFQVTAAAPVVRTRDGQALRLAGRRRGVGCHARPAPRQGSPRAAGTTPSAASSPAGSAFSGRSTPDTRPLSRDDSGYAPPRSCGGDMSSPQKCHLPGTIRQPLQITAVRSGWLADGPTLVMRADLVDRSISDAGGLAGVLPGR